MAIQSTPPTTANDCATAPNELDASKLILNLTTNLKPLPDTGMAIQFGETKTDHMLIANYDPATGWSPPEIKPYGPLSLDPACSCLHYCTNVFEGMKAHRGPDGEPRLFRPEMNVQRLLRSAERVALPPFDPLALLHLIYKLVSIEERWIPLKPGQSLYIRPTIIGTRPTLGVQASDHAMLYIIVSPAGAYYIAPSPSSTSISTALQKPAAPKTISLFALGSTVRSWPGGTGNHKLGSNYAPTFLPQRLAAREGGWNQILWLIGETVTEAGAMNFFVVVKRDNGNEDFDIITPPLDGTILPGITRDSCLALLRAHASSAQALPPLPRTHRLHVHERPLTISETFAWAREGKLVEAFCVGTAVSVVPVGKIGWNSTGENGQTEVVELDGLWEIGMALAERLEEIRSGKAQWEGWSVRCDDRRFNVRP